VLVSAPENLAAIRGVAEIHHRQGNLADALTYYRSALALAKNDPDLQQTVDDLAKQVEPPKPVAAEGLSLEDITKHLTLTAPAPKPAAPKAEQAPPLRPAEVGAQLAAPQAEAPRAEQAPPLQERDPERERGGRTVAALEQMLDAIHVARSESLA
jgi:hypothetical protein